jgi:hypothetical protein
MCDSFRPVVFRMSFPGRSHSAGRFCITAVKISNDRLIPPAGSSGGSLSRRLRPTILNRTEKPNVGTNRSKESARPDTSKYYVVRPGAISDNPTSGQCITDQCAVRTVVTRSGVGEDYCGRIILRS